MGIAFGGKTLKDAVGDAEKLFKSTGHIYGLRTLPLVEEDPARFMKFQMRLVAACVAARSSARYITANPMALLMEELQFMLAVPEGDLAASSYGLIGHLQSAPFIIRAMAGLDFEDNPGIRAGDIFSCNDTRHGAPHNADCFTTIPVFYEGELIAWTMGMSHISDVGAIQAGGLGTMSVDAFTDGFIYPPTKSGENFRLHRWWELHWERRTRTGVFNVMDEKMRATGAIMLHDKVLEVVQEFGADYFREGLREMLERERRVMVGRIIAQMVPGRYGFQAYNVVQYKGIMKSLFPFADRDWLLSYPCATYIRKDGSFLMDLEGVCSEDTFYANCYEPALRMVSSIGCWPSFAYSSTLNTALQYVTDWKLPLGSMFNPQNPFAASLTGLMEGSAYLYMFMNVSALAKFARGYLEEVLPQAATGPGQAMYGVFADGTPWAGGDWPYVCASGGPPQPFRDGAPWTFGGPNPQSDSGEIEVSEFVQPPILYLGRSIIPNYCGHGKYRSGIGVGGLQLILEPGQRLVMNSSIASGSGFGMPSHGIAGGYPEPGDVVMWAHDTNLKEIMKNGGTYPRDIVELLQWVKDGKLRAGKIEVYNRFTPSVETRDGDIFAIGAGAQLGWGDVLERDPVLVEQDVERGWVTPDVARELYGVVLQHGKVNQPATSQLRQTMKAQRKAESVDAREWWKDERRLLKEGRMHADVNNMYADLLKYPGFAAGFRAFWQLDTDFAPQQVRG